jgi:probable HAF family extracellular repeat protein
MLRRGLAMIGVMVLVGAAGAAPAAASSGYTFTNLLTCCTAVGGGAAFDSNDVIADGINNLGDIALTGYGTDGHEHAFIWKNNQFTTLGILGTAPNSGNQISTAGGLNDSDVVVGTSTNGEPGGCCGIGGSESAVIWKPFGTPASTTPFPLGQIDSDSSNCQPSGQYLRFLLLGRNEHQ